MEEKLQNIELQQQRQKKVHNICHSPRTQTIPTKVDSPFRTEFIRFVSFSSLQ